MSNCKNTWPNLSAEFILKAALLERQIRQARLDPVAFAEFAFADESGGRMRLAAIHHELQAFLSIGSRALVELPRDHGKTVQVLIRIVWELGRNPNLRVLLASGSAALAGQRGPFPADAHADKPPRRPGFPHLLPAKPLRAQPV